MSTQEQEARELCDWLNQDAIAWEQNPAQTARNTAAKEREAAALIERQEREIAVAREANTSAHTQANAYRDRAEAAEAQVRQLQQALQQAETELLHCRDSASKAEDLERQLAERDKASMRSLADLTAWLDGLGSDIHKYSLRGIALAAWDERSKQLAACERDAARYRWLRENCTADDDGDGWLSMMFWCEERGWNSRKAEERAQALDENIDAKIAAMQAQHKQEG